MALIRKQLSKHKLLQGKICKREKIKLTPLSQLNCPICLGWKPSFWFLQLFFNPSSEENEPIFQPVYYWSLKLCTLNKPTQFCMVPAFEFVKIEIDFNSNFKANLNPNSTQKLFNFVIWESSRERGATLNCETTLGRRHNCLNWLFQTLFFLKQFFFVQILQVD